MQTTMLRIRTKPSLAQLERSTDSIEAATPRTPDGASIPKPVCPGAPRAPQPAVRLPAVTPVPWTMPSTGSLADSARLLDSCGECNAPLVLVCLPGPPPPRHRERRPAGVAAAAITAKTKRRRPASTRPYNSISRALMFAARLRRAGRFARK